MGSDLYSLDLQTGMLHIFMNTLLINNTQWEFLGAHTANNLCQYVLSSLATTKVRVHIRIRPQSMQQNSSSPF